jgi:hypothetical protein
MLNMDTNMDAMSNTLLHMRNQLNDSQRQINLLNEENIRLKTLYESNSTTININDLTPNGSSHTDRSDKRLHSSNRTTPNKLKSTNNLYDVDETSMDVDSIPLNSTNNDNNQHSTRTTSLENGINVI